MWGGFTEVVAHHAAKSRVEEHAPLCAAFQPDAQGAGTQVSIGCVQANQRPEPDAGAEEQFEDEAIAMSQRAAIVAHDFSETVDFAVGKGCRGFDCRR